MFKSNVVPQCYTIKYLIISFDFLDRDLKKTILSEGDGYKIAMTYNLRNLISAYVQRETVKMM